MSASGPARRRAERACGHDGRRGDVRHERRREHALERADAALIELTSRRAAARTRARASTRSGRPGPRPARRRRRRRRGSASRRRAASPVQPARVARAVEPLVVVEHEPQHAGREAAEVAQQALAGLGVLADLGELGVVERARLRAARRTGPRACPCRAGGRRARAGAVGRAARPSASPTWTASIATRRVWPSVAASFSPSRTTSARTRAPRNASSSATRSVAPRSPTSGREAAARRRSSAAGTASAMTPASSSAVADVEPELREGDRHLREQREREPGHADDGEQVGRAGA